MIRLWFLQNEDSPAANHHKNLVAGLHAQRFAGFTPDHDLILRRESCFRHRFSLWHEVKQKQEICNLLLLAATA